MFASQANIPGVYFASLSCIFFVARSLSLRFHNAWFDFLSGPEPVLLSEADIDYQEFTAGINGASSLMAKDIFEQIDELERSVAWSGTTQDEPLVQGRFQSPVTRAQPSQRIQGVGPVSESSERSPSVYDENPLDDLDFAGSWPETIDFMPVNHGEEVERPSAGQGLSNSVVRHPNDGSTSHRLTTRSDATSSMPVVQGIRLRSTNCLPDHFRSIFPYGLFNAVQSSCFDFAYGTDDNFVLSSPTGSGKTVVMELAICRLISQSSNSAWKVVYQALQSRFCAERHRDWLKKFGSLGYKCSELTGDTTNAQLQHAQDANIIITTPEKWDSMTRKWKEQQRMMQTTKLFLIDEVHMLKEVRGATLEAVVSRMRTIATNIRFVALSATIPNYKDIASWLRTKAQGREIPAQHKHFGEAFRPVVLARHVCGYPARANDFAFDKILDARLPEVIKRYSEQKPFLIFCSTRKACANTCKLLAN